MSIGPRTQWPASRRTALQLALAVIVHADGMLGSLLAQTKVVAGRKAKDAKREAPAIILGRGVEGLPPAVADMRAAILAAAETGDLAELKSAMDLNELPPDFGGPAGVERIEYLKSQSSDGSGKDILSRIAKVLDGGWAAIPGGRDIENNRLYVWPHFAEVPLDQLSEPEQKALADLLGEEAARTSIANRRYQGWRLSIGADGVWHMWARVGGG